MSIMQEITDALNQQKEIFAALLPKNLHRFRFVSNTGLISNQILQSINTWYVEPYNKDVSDFCLEYFAALKQEGLSISCDPLPESNNIRIISANSVDLNKIYHELDKKLSERFPHLHS